MKKRAQYIIEFVFVFPILILALFAVIEYGLFYRDVHVIQDIAYEAATVAAKAQVFSTQTAISLNNVDPLTGCNAATIAVKNAIDKRTSQLDMVGNMGWGLLVYGNSGPETWGIEPYTVYEIQSDKLKSVNGVDTPVLKIILDYRNGADGDLTLQISYVHQTVFFGMSFPVVGGDPVVIIPNTFLINSTEVRKSIMY